MDYSRRSHRQGGRWSCSDLKPPHTPAGGQSEGLEELNKRFWEDLQELSDRFVLTQTSLPGVGFCVRFGWVVADQEEARGGDVEVGAGDGEEDVGSLQQSSGAA